jgi:hypothetical protein
MTDEKAVDPKSVRIPVEAEMYLGEPGANLLARVAGRIGPGGLAATYCDCSTCACGACSCNCSCNACGACYCDCSCSELTFVWRPEDFVSFARVMEALNLRIGEVNKIMEATGKR